MLYVVTEASRIFFVPPPPPQDMDQSFYGDLQSLEEFFTGSEKPAISVAVVSTSSGGHRPLGIYQDEESVDLSALLEACNDANAPVSRGTTNQRSYQGEAITTSHPRAPPTTYFRNFCTSSDIYGSDSCLRMTGPTELPTNAGVPTSAPPLPLDSLAGTRPAPGKAPRPSKASSKKKISDKAAPEYRVKRDRNNVAVRKSRQKSKMRVVETEQRVKELEDENAQLQSKIALLSKELNVLKSLFSSAGVTHPPLRVKEEHGM